MPVYQLSAQGPDTHTYAWRSGKACKLESIKRINHSKLDGIGMGDERHEHAEDGLGAASRIAGRYMRA